MPENKLEFLSGIFSREKIEYFAPIPFSLCRVIDKSKLSRVGADESDIKSAVVFLLPHYAGGGEGNICFYARPGDYHAYADGLLRRLIALLSEKYPDESFFGFSDKSPIAEVSAAAVAGLGVLGKNSLLLNEKYASLVFTAEILSTLPAEELGYLPGEGVKYCRGCGACLAACPMKENNACLSALTQKKGRLTSEEEEYIARYGYAWGCDICQRVCPEVKKVIESGVETPIAFFRENRICNLTSAELEAMSEEEFEKRAFSWRGKATLERNLKILERKK